MAARLRSGMNSPFHSITCPYSKLQKSRDPRVFQHSEFSVGTTGRHHRSLIFTSLIATARPWCDRSSDSVVLRKPARGCRNKQCQLELADRTGVARWVQQPENDPQHVAKLYHFTVPAGLQSAFGGPVYLTHFGRKSPKFGCGADLSRRSLAVRLSAI